MTLTIDPNIADCGMDDAHAERRVSGQVRARAPTGSNAVILLNERSSQSQIVPKSRFQRPIKPETCSPLPSPTLASYIHQFPESRRWIIAPLMRCCPHRPLCMEVSFFSCRYDVPRGVSVLGRGDTKSQRVGCERSHSGATAMSRASGIDHTGGDVNFASMLDNDNRPEARGPEGTKNGINSIDV